LSERALDGGKFFILGIAETLEKVHTALRLLFENWRGGFCFRGRAGMFLGETRTEEQMNFIQFVAWKEGDKIFVERLGRPDEWAEIKGDTTTLILPESVQARRYKPMCLFREYEDGKIEMTVGDLSYWKKIETEVKAKLRELEEQEKQRQINQCVAEMAVAMCIGLPTAKFPVLPSRIHAVLHAGDGIEQEGQVGDLLVLCEIVGKREVQILGIQQMVEIGKLRKFCDTKDAPRLVAEYLAKGSVQGA
jgi:hypothetical protein